MEIAREEYKLRQRINFIIKGLGGENTSKFTYLFKGNDKQFIIEPYEFIQ